MGDRPSGSGRALRLDPYALPVRYAARDSGADGQVRDIELDRERVVLRREVRGIRMKIGVLVTEFTGVTMRNIAARGRGARRRRRHARTSRSRPHRAAVRRDRGRRRHGAMEILEPGARRSAARSRRRRRAPRAVPAHRPPRHRCTRTAPPPPRRDQVAQALDPAAPEARTAVGQSERLSRRARDHRAQIRPRRRGTTRPGTDSDDARWRPQGAGHVRNVSIAYSCRRHPSTSFGAATAAQVSDSHVRETALAGYEPGTIVVKTSQRRLYYVLEDGQTVSYRSRSAKPARPGPASLTSMENS